MDKLINYDHRVWNQDLVRQTFLPFEAEQILAIPIDIQAQQDIYYWNFNRKGEYERLQLGEAILVLLTIHTPNKDGGRIHNSRLGPIDAQSAGG
ncbi:hypothetical protein PIB30_106285 [Stylosanthes scabra]|uniref:Uncharacterized protein n=1 Tax=Stylosanthes scabra TaxID=79078 RepID=A0ABU6TYE8_9FABA|nr:hypothetical protein [Stylosanthes scabra]